MRNEGKDRVIPIQQPGPQLKLAEEADLTIFLIPLSHLTILDFH